MFRFRVSKNYRRIKTDFSFWGQGPQAVPSPHCCAVSLITQPSSISRAATSSPWFSSEISPVVTDSSNAWLASPHSNHGFIHRLFIPTRFCAKVGFSPCPSLLSLQTVHKCIFSPHWLCGGQWVGSPPWDTLLPPDPPVNSLRTCFRLNSLCMANERPAAASPEPRTSLCLSWDGSPNTAWDPAPFP